MAIEAGPEYKIKDAWGGIHYIRFSIVRDVWYTDTHVIIECPNDHICVDKDEWERVKAVVYHTKRPNNGR